MLKFWPFRIGIVLLGIEAALFILCVILDQTLAAKFLSMLAANHIGGRLPFITVGLENGFKPSLIIPIIIIYNTTYIFLVYSLFVFLSRGIKKFKFVAKAIESMKTKAEKRKLSFKRWSRLGIAFFVWIPLPWTGAAIGSFIANLEGYSDRDTLLVVLPSMWIGVISWTLWFDELYKFIDRIGRGKTIFITIFLLVAPVIFYLFSLMFRGKKSK
ncbi:MAG: small multi-drug export protein [Candidatus Aminicenantes bacterium]|nr:MAG: small multi-drug export protein [Candidatus Aminicenantes bacterium]